MFLLICPPISVSLSIYLSIYIYIYISLKAQLTGAKEYADYTFAEA